MCGLVGVLDAQAGMSDEALAGLARGMAASLAHRGPDGDGVWVDAEAGLALGHRRLAIIDLSADGAQPMTSASGRYVTIFNGEIYNFRSLRAELERHGQRFRGHSDTEVLLGAVDHFGVDRALERCCGMFALALWDRETRQIHLARDRLGKKPLYFGWVGDQLLFASELKAFHVHPGFRPVLDRGALALLLRHSYVPAPHAIFENVFKLPAASRLSLRVDGGNAPRGRAMLELIEPYWSALEVAVAGLADPFPGDEEEAVDGLEAVLETAVGERMIADVPLGAFLSGGIDSSTVVALMQKQASQPVRTFSIGFHERGFDEAGTAKAVAAHLGTRHTELYVTPEEARTIIPELPTIYDEPFSDQSQIPTFLVARMAREHVTVALSGDGGDELFGGYQRHYHARTLAGLARLPPALRRGLGGLLTGPSPAAWDRLGGRLTPHLGDKVHKLAGLMAAGDEDAMYLRMTSHWTEPASLIVDGEEPATVLSDPRRAPPIGDFAERMMAIDAVTYLPDDILTKVDRASMAVSLEARAPFLDHRVFAFAWRLPRRLRIRGRQGKWIVRALLERYVPRTLFERPKHGFGMPVGDWLRGPLRDWAEGLLDEGRLRREGIFRPAPIRRAWAEHLAGRRNQGYHLWDVLMVQAWRERWLH